MKKFDVCLSENSEDYLNWDWEKIAGEQMAEFENSSAVMYIDKLLYGYGGFKKYKYGRLLFEFFLQLNFTGVLPNYDLFIPMVLW